MKARLLIPDKRVTKAQALYYFITGTWSVLHLESFLAVTGGKTDVWLVHMVGLLAVSISICLYFDRVSLLLPVSAALSFSAIDIIYVSKGTISPIYLADLAIESLLILLHLKNARRRGIRN